MILAERKTSEREVDDMCFGEGMSDGRLTAPSERKSYRLREAILLSKKLGRPLTENEMKKFEIT